MTNLAKHRQAKGLTQDAVATAIGIANSTYCQYENGLRTVPKQSANAIAIILECNVLDIFLPIKFTVSKSEGNL